MGYNPSYKWINPTYTIYNWDYNPLTKWDEPPSTVCSLSWKKTWHCWDLLQHWYITYRTTPPPSGGPSKKLIWKVSQEAIDRIFHEIKHLCWGTPMTMESPIGIYRYQVSEIKRCSLPIFGSGSIDFKGYPIRTEKKHIASFETLNLRRALGNALRNMATGKSTIYRNGFPWKPSLFRGFSTELMIKSIPTLWPIEESVRNGRCTTKTLMFMCAMVKFDGTIWNMVYGHGKIFR